ncbi:MAG: type IV secretion system DNA-binding domain-containing protein [Candidatus Nomurabacteria bacterium]|nr:type IV secretion system DNA-binding domain-containing protein [Candidatus Nomurabacteria bacterium]
MGIIVLVIILGMIALLVAQQLKARRIEHERERGLQMRTFLIHLPPSAEDIKEGSRDERDITEETIAQAQSLYAIIASNYEKNFRRQLWGQEHISFEIIATDGMIEYYVSMPAEMAEIVRQAVATSYPTAKLEEAKVKNIFQPNGSVGVVGGELDLRKEGYYPIASYQETKQDIMRALLNALGGAKKGDGVAVQFLLRPAGSQWVEQAKKRISDIKGGKKTTTTSVGWLGDLTRSLWKPPEWNTEKTETTLTPQEQAEIDAITGKIKASGFETLIRIIASSENRDKSTALVGGVSAAFSLLDDALMNGFKITMAKDVERLETDYMLRVFPVDKNKNILNSLEAASIFHFPNQKDIPTSNVKRLAVKQVDGPAEEVEGGLVLGINEFRDQEKIIRLSDKDRLRHTYIIGQTGTGKSVMLKNLAYQDLMAGRGFALIDPHGDLAESLLGLIPENRIDDVIYFNPNDRNSPIGLNIFEMQNEDQMDFVIGEMINMLYSLYDPGHTGIVGPRMENIVRNAAVLLMSDPNGATFMDIPKVLVDPNYAASKLQYVKNQRAIDFWTKEWPAAQKSNDAGEVTSWVVSKWAPFENDAIRNILGQVKSGFSIREIMDNKKILLVNLSKGLLGEQAAKLLGMVFVMKFQAAAMSRADTPEDKREPFCLYVDEFQNFATDSFESILSEARKYQLNLILANQFMSQLTDKIREAILGNVGTVISARIGITDAEVLVKKFAPVFSAEDLTKLPNFNGVATVLINSVPSSPFSLTWTWKSTPESNAELQKAVAEYSAARYGRPRAEVLAEISARLGVKDMAKVMQGMQNATQNPQQSNSADSMPAMGAPEGPQGASSRPSFLEAWNTKKRSLSGSEGPQNAPQSVSDAPVSLQKQGSAPATPQGAQDSEQIFKIR